jgi:hypothetical protein
MRRILVLELHGERLEIAVECISLWVLKNSVRIG